MSASPMQPAPAAGTLRRLRAAAAPLAKTALLRLGGYAALRRVRPSRDLAILRYHAICGDEGYAYADPQICITPQAFERHIARLSESYRIVRLEDAARALATGAPLPLNAVAITFDDGYADNLAAAHILHQYGATATFYITAGCMAGDRPFWPVEVRYLVRALPAGTHRLAAGTVRLELPIENPRDREAAVRRLTRTFKSHPIPVRDKLRDQLRSLAGDVAIPRVMLTWDEVREMHALGMTIGSHTLTHPNLPSAGIPAAREELRESKRRLEGEIGAPVTMFSYPNGGAERYLTAEVQRAVREAGYLAATTSRNAFAQSHSDVFALERIEVEERLEDLLFALEVERFAFKPGP